MTVCYCLTDLEAFLTIGSRPKSKLQLLYDWRFTANPFVLATKNPWESRPDFFQLNPCSHSPYVTSSLMREWVCLLWICLAFRQVYVSHIQHVTEHSCFCTIYKSSVSPAFAGQVMSILSILCYNGSLVTWVVESLKLWTKSRIKSQNQNQSYFTTDDLPPISSSWR
jgi:hypothetical protein